MLTATAPTPLGDMVLLADTTSLLGAWFVGQKYYPALQPNWTASPSHSILRQAAKELEEYFAGTRKNFSVPMAPRGTSFQQRIWHTLQSIPYGGLCSYSDIGHLAKAPSPRAVGTAVGRNPLSIFIPCHRVLGKDGSLTGYAGGLDRKKYLLALEQGNVNVC